PGLLRWHDLDVLGAGDGLDEQALATLAGDESRARVATAEGGRRRVETQAGALFLGAVAGVAVLGQERFDVAQGVHRLRPRLAGWEEKNDRENEERFHAVVNQMARVFAVRCQRHKGGGFLRRGKPVIGGGGQSARHVSLTSSAFPGTAPGNYPSTIPA